MGVLIICAIGFVICSGGAALFGKAITEAMKNCGREMYLEIRTLWSKN